MSTRSVASDGLLVTMRPLFRRERRQSVIAGDGFGRMRLAELAVREPIFTRRGAELALTARVVMGVTYPPESG